MFVKVYLWSPEKVKKSKKGETKKEPKFVIDECPYKMNINEISLISDTFIMDSKKVNDNMVSPIGKYHKIILTNDSTFASVLSTVGTGKEGQVVDLSNNLCISRQDYLKIAGE